MALCVSGAVAFGGVGVASATQGAKSVPTVATSMPQKVSRNSAPLAPGGAAGIQQAQGGVSNNTLLIGGSILAGVAILILVGSGDGDSSSPSTGTN
jgi:hypothetical protein